MSYLALYRRYRPQTFDEMVGQDFVVTTLKNQIKSGQISHAYLFTGTRGTGKTTAAKVFSRAINCENPVDGNPCMKCRSCLDSGGMDIVELDAASNNGVEYIRDIKEKVQYAPSSSKYKVYIIDEVHMLSQSAFNAFLKTLEEPPAHAVFILCTTEAYKIPQTILSRCMRFDFRLVGVEKLETLVGDILTKAGKSFTPEALNAIAVAGEGSARDALSVADRCLAFCGDRQMTYEDVLDVLGANDGRTVNKLASFILNADIAAFLELTDKVVREGKSVNLLARDVAKQFRDMAIIKLCAVPRKLLNVPENMYSLLEECAKDASVKKLLYAAEVFGRIDGDLRYALNPRILFEATAIKVANSTGEVDADSLDKRLRRLEKRQASNSAPASSSPASVQFSAQTAEKRRADNASPQTEFSLPAAGVKDYNAARRVWASVLREVHSLDEPIFSTVCTEVSDCYILNGELVLGLTQGQLNLLGQKQNTEKLQKLLSACAPLKLVLKLRDKRGDAEETLEAFRRLAGNSEFIVTTDVVYKE